MLSLRQFRTLKSFLRHQSVVVNSCQQKAEPIKHKFLLSKPILNEEFLLDEKNKEQIDENIKLRKGVGDIQAVHDIKNKLKTDSLSQQVKEALKQQLQEELRKIPNETHPEVRGYGAEPKIVSIFNEEPVFKHTPLEFSEITKKLNILRTDHLGNFAGSKSFFLMNDLAELVSLNTLISFYVTNETF